MRRIAFSAICLLFVAQAFAQATFVLPNRSNQQHVELQAVVVSGVGQDEKAALDNALAIAVERIVGTLVTTELYISNGSIISDEIVRLAPAYVDSYELLYKGQSGNMQKVTIEAVVAKRKLAEKLSGINIAILEVEDSELARAQLLAAISDSSNKLAELIKTFKRTFGNLNNLTDTKIEKVHFFTADADDGKIPMSVVINMSINPQRYEQFRQQAGAALVSIGAVYTPEVGVLKLEEDRIYIDNMLNEDYRILFLRNKGNSFVFDAYDLAKLEEEYKQAVNHSIYNHSLMRTIYKDNFHVMFKDQSGKVIFEDYIPIMTMTWQQDMRDNENQRGLSLVWSSENPQFDRTFPLKRYDDNINATLDCALIYDHNPNCVVPEKQTYRSPRNAMYIIPLFQARLDADNGFFLNTYADSLSFEYKTEIDVDMIEQIAEIVVDTVYE